MAIIIKLLDDVMVAASINEELKSRLDMVDDLSIRCGGEKISRSLFNTTRILNHIVNA